MIEPAKCPCPICGKVHLTLTPNHLWGPADCYVATQEDKIAAITARFATYEAAIRLTLEAQKSTHNVIGDRTTYGYCLHVKAVKALTEAVGLPMQAEHGIEVPK